MQLSLRDNLKQGGVVPVHAPRDRYFDFQPRHWQQMWCEYQLHI